MTQDTVSSIHGGCQCGRLRYTATASLEMIHYCHCRMCQRALGNAFALVAGVPSDKLVWSGGQPRVYASSSRAARSFCAECGTPLAVNYRDSLFTFVTIGSLDHPDRAVPEKHYGVESRLPWLAIDDDLPRQATLDDPRLRNMVVHQFPLD